MRILLIFFLLTHASQAFSFSKKMENYKLSFNQKRQVKDLASLIDRLPLNQENTKFFKSILNQFAENDLPLLEFHGKTMVFKYRNQKSKGVINLERGVLNIDGHVISLKNLSNPIELYNRINQKLSSEEGNGFIMFLTSETRKTAPLLNDKLEALFWGMSTLVAQSPLTLPREPVRSVASEKK